MPRAQWSLRHGQLVIQVVLTMAQSGQKLTRALIADTGAGAEHAPFEMVLQESDCLQCGGAWAQTVTLEGAYLGSYPRYLIRVEIPLLGFNRRVFAVGVPKVPDGFDGIAGFRFLNRFTYGNFGNPIAFGLEM